MALKIYCHRIRKYIGAYAAVLEDLDALIFTGGIGENAPLVRELCCRGLNRLGIVMDAERNHVSGSGLREISPPNGEVRVLIVPTDEALRIAQLSSIFITSQLWMVWRSVPRTFWLQEVKRGP